VRSGTHSRHRCAFFASPEIFAVAIFDAISGSTDMLKMRQNLAIDLLYAQFKKRLN